MTGSPDDASVDMLAAALRADAADLDVYVRVLTESLAEALPAGMVEVERAPSLRDRLAARPGLVKALRIDLGDLMLELTAARSGTRGRALRVVRGVVISTRDVDMDEWTRLLAEALARRASESAAARAALARLFD